MRKILYDWGMDNRGTIIRDWALLAVATVALLSTLGLVRDIVSFLDGAGYEWVLRHGIVAVLAAVGLTALIYLVGIAKVSHVKTYIYVLGLAVVYVLILWKLSRLPVEQVHLLEYGLIGILSHRAVRHHTPEPGCTLLAVLVTLNIGLLDELVQGILPSRFYDTKDVLTNAAGGLLGVLMATVLKNAPRTTAQKKDIPSGME